MKYKIGLYKKNIGMFSKEILEEKVLNIEGHDSKFEITSGQLILNGCPLKKTYLLEIHYKNSQDEHSKTLPLNGWNRQLSYDYMGKAHTIAKQFCEENNMIINHHINSWPEYQAIVSKK